MKALSFLIICLIVSNNTVSTSKGGQSSINRKKDLSTSDEPRNLDGENYMEIYYTKYPNEVFTYSSEQGFLNRKSISSIKIITGGRSTSYGPTDALTISPGSKLEIYYRDPIETLKGYFNEMVDAPYIEPIDLDANAGRIESIDFTHFDSSNVKSLSGFCSGCSSLISINFGNFIGTNVESMEGMFGGCGSLISVNLPNFIGSKITSMSYMFSDCYSLTSVNLENFTGLALTSTDYMFSGCSSLKSINLHNFIGANEIYMDSMFSEVDSLKYIDLSNLYYKDPLFNLISDSDMNLKYMNIYNSQIDYTDIYNFMQSYISRNPNEKIFMCLKNDMISKLTEDKQKEINNHIEVCCDYDFENSKCKGNSFVSTFIQESTFIKPQSTVNTIITDKTIFTEDNLMTTNLIENDTNIDTSFVKESTYIPKETEGFTDFRSTIFKEPTTFIIPETEQLESTVLEEKAQTTTDTFKETTNALDILFNTSNIETTLINKESTNPIIETTSSIKETTRVTSKSSTQSVSTNENVFPSTDIKESTNIEKESELKTTSFIQIATSIIKETTGAKTSIIIHSTSIPTEKENQKTSIPEQTTTLTTTSVENQQTTSNLFSTSTSEPKQEPSTSEPKQEPSTSEPKQEHTTSEQIPEPTNSEQKQEPTTSEVKTTQYSIVTTSINNPTTEIIPTTILNHINLTSIASTEIKIPTTIADYGSASVILVGLSHFISFISYFTFNIHFRSVRGFIFSFALTVTVQLTNNRLLRILQNHQANCEKANDDLENADYLCTVLADTSTVNRIKIISDFNFDSQDIKIAGISPIAHTLMENVQNATGEYDTLLQSNYYILEHSNITANKTNKVFNITGIINDPKFNLSNIDLTLIINAEKGKDILEEEANCTIVNINDSNYNLNCLGEKNILYNLQSAVSFINNDTLLLINFDENITSKILFDSSSSYKFRKKDTNGLSAGAIVAIILVLLIVLATAVTLVALRKKMFLPKTQNNQESTMVNLAIN